MLIGIEKSSRRHQQNFQPSASRFRKMDRTPLRKHHALIAWVVCALPILLGFIIPAWILADYAVQYFGRSWNADFRTSAINSITLSAIAAMVAVLVGILLSYSKRLHPTPRMKFSVGIASLGYAVPGAVLAIGIMIPFAALDHTINAISKNWFGFSTGLLLSHMDDAARSLGHSPGTILRVVHLPLMRGGILTAALVVFVDCMKELPATLVLRPFNYETLATQVYQFASDELIGQSALYALLIVLVGLIPVILLSASIDKSRNI